MINVIGIGLQGANSLTSDILAIIEQSTVLVGSDRHLSYFPNYLGERLILDNFTTVFATLKERLKRQETIVILVSGDPLFFGLGRLLIENFSPEQLTFYPHLSSVQLAFNRLKLTWQDAEIVSVHGRSLELLISPLQKGVKKLAILTDDQNHPGAIAALFRSLDLPLDYEFWVCESLGSTEEKINYYSAQDLEQWDDQHFSPLNVVILVRKNESIIENLELNNLPLFGISDHHFFSFDDRPGLMTKREIRV
ncbi:MAG: precorrin-6y C5,15-methyltransferase (decarboxylating) subunit CbiE, partial [Microcystaceae cyanobacterium]